MTAATPPGVQAPPDADVLDCVSGNLALLVQRAGAGDARAGLASQWTFGRGGELPRVEHTDRLEHLRLATGAHVTVTPLDPPFAGALAAAVADAGAVLVEGDAHDFGWTPYAGRRHIGHSAVVIGVDERDGRAEVVDVYTADTDLGSARPIRTSVALGDLERATRSTQHGPRAIAVAAGSKPRLGDRELFARNARALARDVIRDGAIAAFAGDCAGRGLGADAWRATELACWLVARSRAAHARFLRAARARAAPIPSGFEDEFATEVAGGWAAVVKLAFLGRRRAETGRAAPPHTLAARCAQLQEAESRLARALGEACG